MSRERKPRVKEQLAELDVRPSKVRGQNFLRSQETARRIADWSGVGSRDWVLEIGPGLGMLTRELLTRTEGVVAVEVDRRLASELPAKVPGLAPDDIIAADIRELSLEQLCSTRGLTALGVVSNLPYSISSDVIAWIVEQRERITYAVLLLQKEFAERAAAGPGSKRYGALSVYCGQYLQAELGFTVGGREFHPPAGVVSRLLKLTPRKEPRAAVADQRLFRQVVRAAFSMRRKVLSNSLAQLPMLAGSADAASLLEKIGIDPRRRPETLTIEEFAAIADALPPQAGGEV